MNEPYSKALKIAYVWLGILSVLLVILFIKLTAKSDGLGERIDAVVTRLAESFTQTREAVKAKEFLLVDEAGTVRARLHVKATAPNGAVLLLSDPDSNSTAEFGIMNHAPQISLSDKKGSKRIFLGFAPDKEEQAFLKLSGKNGNSEVQLSAQAEHPSGLFLYGKDGAIRSQLSIGNDRPTFYFFDKQGDARLSMGVTNIPSPDGSETKTSESTIYLFGPDGKPLWRAPQ
jgi:hypothetical protein